MLLGKHMSEFLVSLLLTLYHMILIFATFISSVIIRNKFKNKTSTKLSYSYSYVNLLKRKYICKWLDRDK
ncbi:hypothetical protein DWX94_10510 [Coprococcus eutactus]|uniref:Uncharacterized protein n=1 Tax=Coprococcus eutactus TaxID=33043 RepID=A0A412IQ89_9FIRM|nr:hypothetical protein DWX94_10510 [Coprococcus eutactus]